MRIEYKSLVATPTTEADLEWVLTTERDDANALYIRQWTDEQHLEALSDPNIAHLILKDNTNNRKVGYAILIGCESADQSLLFKRLVIVDKGKGFGRMAMNIGKILAFDILGFHRLWLDVHETNARGRHIYSTEGFIEEGMMREEVKRGDIFVNLVLMSMLREEYYKSK